MTNRAFKNHSFKSARGNEVTVWQEFEMDHRNGFVGRKRCTRTFAVVCNQEVEVERGCAFKAPSAVAAAGF